MGTIITDVSNHNAVVDATPSALRVINYNTAGYPTFANMSWTAIYGTKVEIIPSTLTAGTCYWACRNLGSRMAYLVSLELITEFSGTAAATRSIFDIGRFTGATPTGGTTLDPCPLSSNYPATTMTDVRYAPGGLTVTGITFGPPVGNFSIRSQLADGKTYTLSASVAGFEIAPNEGFYIRCQPTSAVISGAAITGHALWAEAG